MRLRGIVGTGSRLQSQKFCFKASRPLSLSLRRHHLEHVYCTSNETPISDSSAEDSEQVEVILLTPKLEDENSSDITTLRQAPVPESNEPSSSESESTESSPMSKITEKIFSSGAEAYLEQKTKPLKINRDLILYRAKLYRRRGVNSPSYGKRIYWFKRSERNYTLALKMDPTDARTYVGIGRLYELWKRFDKAGEVYENGCAVAAGKNAHIWTSWGNLEMKNRNIDTAREYFKAAIIADRTHQVAWHSLGVLEKSVEDYQAARDCWIQGIKNSKNRSTPYFYQSLALLSSELGLFETAREWFKRGTEKVTGSRSYALWHEWAVLEGKLGNHELMEELFRKTLKLKQKSRYTYLTWARIEQEAGNTYRARQLLLEGHKLNPQDPALLHALAILESEYGNFEEARRNFQKSLEIDPKYQLSWQAWGVLEFRYGNPEKSRKLFQRGVWSAPKSKKAACVFHAWGKLEESLGNDHIARICYKYGIKVDSKHEALWETWINMEKRIGNYDRANELRNYSMQERRQIALPKDFDMLNEDTNALEDFFVKVTPNSLSKSFAV
eukprot:g3128.t1